MPVGKVAIGGAVVLGCLLLIGALLMRDARETARSEEKRRRDHVVVEEDRRKAEAENDARVAAAKAETERRAKADLELFRGGLVGSTPAVRESSMRACSVGGCPAERQDMILALAVSDAERSKLRAIAQVEPIMSAARRASDGERLSVDAALEVARLLGLGGTDATLSALPKVSLGEAAKDLEFSRGKVARASGNVIEIQRDGERHFTGSIYASGTIVRFITALPTPGIVKGTWASFRGVVMQEYAYKNVSGGQTRSIALVGAFSRPEE